MGNIVGIMVFAVAAVLAANFISTKERSLTLFGYGLAALSGMVALSIAFGLCQSLWEAIP